MIPTQIQGNIVRIDTPAVYAFYIVSTSKLYPLALVCNNNDVLVGVISKQELLPKYGDVSQKTCGQICNRNFVFLNNQDEEALYAKARNIFAEKKITTLPVLDNSGIPLRLFGEFQAFFQDMYKSLPYYNYAHGIIKAARLAKSRGYNRISVIEFGVAEGKGLIHLGIYAREIQRLFGIAIDVFGFDSGHGLFKPNDYRDCPHIWIEGDHKMDIDILKSKLYNEELIIGDICNTAKKFFSDYNPAPIGFISIDVDQYTPTVAILDMLLNDDKYFLPIIPMYFDDVSDAIEFQGEALAIKEFNAKNETIKISPENIGYDHIWENSIKSWEDGRIRGFARLKYCNRFNHHLYATPRKYNISV